MSMIENQMDSQSNSVHNFKLYLNKSTYLVIHYFDYIVLWDSRCRFSGWSLQIVVRPPRYCKNMVSKCIKKSYQWKIVKGLWPKYKLYQPFYFAYEALFQVSGFSAWLPYSSASLLLGPVSLFGDSPEHPFCKNVISVSDLYFNQIDFSHDYLIYYMTKYLWNRFCLLTLSNNERVFCQAF